MAKVSELTKKLNSIQKNFILKKKYDIALEDLRKLNDDFGDDDHILYYMGVCFANMGDLRKAIEHLSILSDSDRLSIVQLTQVNMILGYAYTDMEDFYNAELSFKRALEINPGSSMSHSALGYVYYLAKKYDLAILNFKKAIEIDPNNASARNNLGYTYAEIGINLNEAAAECRKAVALSPNSAAYRDSLGWVYYTMSNFKEAVDELQKALQYPCSRQDVVSEHLSLAVKKRDNRK
jgi:tetratricopeptide (TPR) repeat protein